VEIGQHLNGDEAMTFGAAFHAANKTNLFRVRPVYIYEAYEQGFVGKFEGLDSESKEYQAQVDIFDKEHHLDFVKIVEIEHDDNLRLSVDFEKGEGERENLVNY
jgi:hypoxia up-regulated 1